MLEHSDVGITTTHALSFLESETHPPDWFKPDKHLGDIEGIIPSTLVVRKNVFREIGGFSPDYRASEDTEWLCRAKDAQVAIVHLPESLTLRRLHGDNLSWQMASTFSSRALKIFKESIARKSRQNR